jgi:sulfite dehydrogenase (cytochrome) subunit A
MYLDGTATSGITCAQLMHSKLLYQDCWRFAMSQSASDRRRFLKAATFGSVGLFQACRRTGASNTAVFQKGLGRELKDDWSSTRDLRPLVRFPQKAPLILLTDRAPQLETSLHYFREDLTPNNVHFVRWHLAGIATAVNIAEWRLEIAGAVNRPVQLSMDELRRRFEAVSLIALNQCSGNSRGLFSPRVPGGQWRHGAMGNARWTGVRLKDILDYAGVKASAVEVSFRGLDVPPLSTIPVVERSLKIDHARDGEVMVAYEMNEAPLPILNGFPVRLIVPGWYGTWWIKSLSFVTVRDTPLRNFWMEKAYRIPNTPDVTESPNHPDADTVPINKFAVHSIFVSPEPGETVVAGRPREVQGLAMDYGAGIKRVEFSSDGGRSWTETTLDPDLGRYSWRRWRIRWLPPKPGLYRWMVRATNNAGVGQLQYMWNRGGYHRSVIEHMDVKVV